MNTKKKRGAPPGNQNARKHGFYSQTLTPDQICSLWNIANQEGIDPEIAVLRLKIHSVLQNDPGNGRVLREATKLLTRWYTARYGLDPSAGRYLKAFVTRILQSCPGPSPSVAPGGDCQLKTDN